MPLYFSNQSYFSHLLQKEKTNQGILHIGIGWKFPASDRRNLLFAARELEHVGPFNLLADAAAVLEILLRARRAIIKKRVYKRHVNPPAVCCSFSLLVTQSASRKNTHTLTEVRMRRIYSLRKYHLRCSCVATRRRAPRHQSALGRLNNSRSGCNKFTLRTSQATFYSTFLPVFCKGAKRAPSSIISSGWFNTCFC